MGAVRYSGMRTQPQAGHAIARLLAAFGIVSVLCGSFCSVTVCHEECDPCLSQCKCDNVCEGAALGGRASYRLASYRLSIVDDDRGGVVRSFSEVVGLSLDLAWGPRAHAAEDFARFAEGVIESNGLLLRPRRGAWKRRPVEAFDGGVVVPFTNEGGEASLAFLFDRDGILLQIDEVRR